MTGMMPLNTFLSSTRFTSRSFLLLVLSWGSLSAERIIPHIMGPDPKMLLGYFSP